MDLMKKMWPSLAASLVAFTGAVSADCPPSPCCPCPQKVDRMPPACEINTSVNPVVSCGNGLFFTASAFYWESYEDGLAYGILQEGNIDPNIDTQYVFNNASMKNPNFNWDFGFKFGLGYSFIRDGWDLYANWTHFRNDWSHSQEADVGERLYTLWSAAMDTAAGQSDLITLPQSGSLFAEDIKTNYELNFDMIDLELGREFYTSRYLALRPFFGLRGGRFDLKYHLEHNGGSFGQVTQPSTFTGYADHVHLKNDFWGVGPRFGMNSEWSFGCGWSLYGDLGLSILLGRFEVSNYEFLRDISSAANPINRIDLVDLDDDYKAMRAMTDLGLGLRWETMFDNANMYFTMQFGWEHHMLFNHNQLTRVHVIPDNPTTPPPDGYNTNVFIPEHGDLQTQGWTLSARLDF